MALLRLAVLATALTAALAGCVPGAPHRASDIQNLNGISDDISAVRMTQPDTNQARDPNVPSTLPHGNEVDDR